MGLILKYTHIYKNICVCVFVLLILKMLRNGSLVINYIQWIINPFISPWIWSGRFRITRGYWRNVSFVLHERSCYYQVQIWCTPVSKGVSYPQIHKLNNNQANYLITTWGTLFTPVFNYAPHGKHWRFHGWGGKFHNTIGYDWLSNSMSYYLQDQININLAV